ncbi:MAG: YcxB family protein [Candidatus Thorarchaeota archaeon]
MEQARDEISIQYDFSEEDYILHTKENDNSLVMIIFNYIMPIIFLIITETIFILDSILTGFTAFNISMIVVFFIFYTIFLIQPFKRILRKKLQIKEFISKYNVVINNDGLKILQENSETNIQWLYIKSVKESKNFIKFYWRGRFSILNIQYPDLFIPKRVLESNQIQTIKKIASTNLGENKVKFLQSKPKEMRDKNE